MKKIQLKSLDETILYEKLPCGLEVYLLNRINSKNFYASISTKYGSSTIKYKNNDKVYDIIPGSAHFLEHKVMNYTSNKKAFDMMNNLGSLANAYTTDNLTNYNIFGNVRLEENLSLLYDLVMNASLTEASVNSEKGIIKEEISTNDDDIPSLLYTLLNRNMFHSSYSVNHTLGETSDIDKMDAKDLMRIYNDFYNLNNMFTVVTGSFNEEEILNHIKSYFKDYKNKPYNIKKIIEKEKDDVKVVYSEIEKNINLYKVIYGIKINTKIFSGINKVEIDNYISIILDATFGQTSYLRQSYLQNEYFISLNADYKIIDNHLLIFITASTNKPDQLLQALDNDTKKFDIDEKTFERKKKVILSNLIMSFETVEDAEDIITTEVSCYNKVIPLYAKRVKDLNYKTIKNILKNFNNKYKSSIKVLIK
ncbi:MAG: pitrilysin family protein [Bacilli bacterium]